MDVSVSALQQKEQSVQSLKAGLCSCTGRSEEAWRLERREQEQKRRVVGELCHAGNHKEFNFYSERNEGPLGDFDRNHLA